MTTDELRREAYGRLAALQQAVAALYDADEAEARSVMAEVSAFETDWWGTHSEW